MPTNVRISTTVAVLGAGTMGRGIAQVTAASGFFTRMADVDVARAENSVAQVAAQWEGAVTKGKMSDGDRKAALQRLRGSPDLRDACDGAEIVIEAVPEDMDLKVGLMKEVAALVSPRTILASNTSSLSLTELGTKVGLVDRVIGLHFFNPAPVMELLEVVRGLGTSDETVERARAFARALGKTPIVVSDTPGFATSRLGVLLGAEAIRMLETGVATAADIDRAMELGYRHPMGPLKLTDLVGLDVRLAILEHLHREIGEQFRPPPLLRTMVRAGKLGKKTGEGFYRWIGGIAEEKKS